MAILTTTNYDHLIDDLRLHIGDIDSTSYRYQDEWLRTSLNMSIKSLQRWWNSKYLVDTDEQVERNSNVTFSTAEPPIIEHKDERIIVLMSSIIIKRGSLEDNAWSIGSWKDAEISWSSIQGGKTKQASLADDWMELVSLIKPPTKRLRKSIKASLPGYLHNEYDRILGNK